MSEAELTRIRLDRLLVYLRFARTRSAARSVIESGVVRLNRNRVLRVSENIAVLAPSPNARVSTAITVKPGFFTNVLKPYRKSCQKLSIISPRVFWLLGYESIKSNEQIRTNVQPLPKKNNK